LQDGPDEVLNILSSVQVGSGFHQCGDHDVGERVRGDADVGHRLLARRLGQAELEHAHGLAAVGHRREQGRPVVVPFDLDAPSRQSPAVRCARERDALGGCLALGARGERAMRVAEADQRLAAEVRDLGCAERL
jgi:hypothetical protein